MSSETTPNNQYSAPEFALPVDYRAAMADQSSNSTDQSLNTEAQLEAEQARAKAASFIEQNADTLALLVGVRGLDIKVGKGWTTNLKTGEVTVDPSFFISEGYRPEWVVYGTLHELTAHLRELITEPQLSAEVRRFGGQSGANAIFHKILSDIAGNREIHGRLPSMEAVGRSAYEERLFPGNDYRTKNNGMAPEGANHVEMGRPIPRHLQFLYKMIRQEMIPGSETTVLPEVDEAIASLRDWKESGRDVIKMATDPARSPRERYEMMLALIHPAYLSLLEQDKQDPDFDKSGGQSDQGGEPGESSENDQSGEQSVQESESEDQAGEGASENGQDESQQGENGEDGESGDESQVGQSGESGDGEDENGKEAGSGGQSGENEDGEEGGKSANGESDGDEDGSDDEESQGDDGEEGSDGGSDQGQSGGKGASSPDFSDYYQDIMDKHPEPFDEEQERDIQNQVAKQQREAQQQARQNTPEAIAARAQERQTGHSRAEIQRYRKEMTRYHETIEQMQEFFEAIISRRLAYVRRFDKPSRQGVMLDPSLVAQTHVDVQAGINDPATFLNYENQIRPAEAIGGYDLHLVIDTSGSMQGEPAHMAASSAMIFTEGLDLFEQRIREVESQERVQLGLDVRTQVVSFGSSANILKELSPALTEKERLDIYSDVAAANGGGTADYLALEKIIADHEASTQSASSTPPATERKRLVIVETDGNSSDPARATAAIARLRELGFSVLGVGIIDQSAESLYAPDGRTISDPSQLPDALVSILETSL